MIKIFGQSLTNEPESDAVRETSVLDSLLSSKHDVSEGEKFADQVWTRATQVETTDKDKTVH